MRNGDSLKHETIDVVKGWIGSLKKRGKDYTGEWVEAELVELSEDADNIYVRIKVPKYLEQELKS